MAKGINLIPKEERYEQNKAKALKASTIFSIILLLLVSFISFYLFFAVKDLKDQLAILQQENQNIRNSISQKTDIEVNARNLYTKAQVLNEIFGTYKNYSNILDRLEANIPTGVNVTEFILGSDDSFNISGVAAEYNLIQEFINRLLKDELFAKVSLNSVSLDDRSGGVRYFLVVNYKVEKLK